MGLQSAGLIQSLVMESANMEYAKTSRPPGTPTGFHPSAQGCRVGKRGTATLGFRPTNISPLSSSGCVTTTLAVNTRRGAGERSRRSPYRNLSNQLNLAKILVRSQNTISITKDGGASVPASRTSPACGASTVLHCGCGAAALGSSVSICG